MKTQLHNVFLLLLLEVNVVSTAVTKDQCLSISNTAFVENVACFKRFTEKYNHTQAIAQCKVGEENLTKGRLAVISNAQIFNAIKKSSVYQPNEPTVQSKYGARLGLYRIDNVWKWYDSRDNSIVANFDRTDSEIPQFQFGLFPSKTESDKVGHFVWRKAVLNSRVDIGVLYQTDKKASGKHGVICEYAAIEITDPKEFVLIHEAANYRPSQARRLSTKNMTSSLLECVHECQNIAQCRAIHFNPMLIPKCVLSKDTWSKAISFESTEQPSYSNVTGGHWLDLSPVTSKRQMELDSWREMLPEYVWNPQEMKEDVIWDQP